LIETRAPGKLFVLGEYAVVTAGQPSVLVAVDRYITVRLDPNPAPRETSSPHVREAIRVIEELRESRGIAPREFSLEIRSDLEDARGAKLGLGSSAAVTVAVIDALDRHYGLSLEPLERFKLALLATIELAPLASGGDLAVSTFGGWVRYVAPDRAALRDARATHGVAHALGHAAWSQLEIRHLQEPSGLELLVGWTGSPASTERLVDEMTAREVSTVPSLSQQSFLQESRTLTDGFTSALTKGAWREAAAAVRAARSLLQRLGAARGIEIETGTLGVLCDVAEQHGAVAKPSGAGGGDCGIAFATPDADIAGILREWQQSGIHPLDLRVTEPVALSKGASHEH